MTDDPIGAAVRADAEAARAEIRAEGIICPSCGVNMADLPDGHMLVLSDREPWTAKCADGTLTALAASSSMGDEEFATWQAAANISLYDDFRKREAEAFRRIIGDGPGDFTGLLSILEHP